MKNGNDILKELEEIAPALSKIEKKSFDEVSAHFFSSFPEAMMKKVREQELVEIAPTLSQQEKVNALEVPANYFKGFSDVMLKKISAEQKPRAVIVPKWQKSLNNIFNSVTNVVFQPRYAFAFAGTVSMLVIGVMFFTKVEQCNDLECKMASLTDAEINAYLDSNADEYSDEVFEATLDESVNGIEIYKDAFKGISDDELDNAILD